MELDSELIIVEVKKYPALYDSKHEHFKVRNIKVDEWKKVAEGVVGELYNELSTTQQNEIGKEIQKRWKTMRDSFIRSHKIVRASKRGSGASKKRDYIYAQQMSFLLPIIECRPTSGNINDLQCHDETESSDTKTSILGSIPITSCSQSSFPPPKPKKRKEPFETQLISMLQAQNPTSVADENDPEKMFLLSLLPSMKKLKASALFDFKIKSMQLLQSYLNNTENFRNAISVNPPLNPIHSTPSPHLKG